jgi:hypothetical protein
MKTMSRLLSLWLLFYLIELVPINSLGAFKAIINGDFSRAGEWSGFLEAHQWANFPGFLLRAPCEWECWMTGNQIPVGIAKRSRCQGVATLKTASYLPSIAPQLFFGNPNPDTIRVNLTDTADTSYNGTFTLVSATPTIENGQFFYIITYDNPGDDQTETDAQGDILLESMTLPNCGAHSTHAVNVKNWSGDRSTLIHRAADEGFDIFILYRGGVPEVQEAASYAIEHGMAIFQTHDDNSYLRIECPDVGTLPYGIMTIAGGDWQSPTSLNTYGPTLEFIDWGVAGAAQSYALSSTAAKYAKIKSSHPAWNVFDIRQALRQTGTFYPTTRIPYTSGWREDGGYGFAQVENRIGMPDQFIEAKINGKVISDPTLTTSDLEPGAPLERRVELSANQTQISLHWKNFRQTGFACTVIKLDGTTVYDGTGTSFTTELPATGAFNAQFFTKLSDGRLSRSEPLAIPITPLFANAQFNAAGRFEFTIHGISGENVAVFSSADLTDPAGWQPRGHVTLVGGAGIFEDAELTGNDKYRFYLVTCRETYSRVFGFIKVTVPAYTSTDINSGTVLIANQLDYGNNTLAEIFAHSDIPGLLTLSKENADRTGYENSTYDPDLAGWSNPMITLSPGEGAWLQNGADSECTVRFIGYVREQIDYSPPSGFSIRSSILPKAEVGTFVSTGATLKRWNGAGLVEYAASPNTDPPDTDLWEWSPPMIPPINVGEAYFFKPADFDARTVSSNVRITPPILKAGYFRTDGAFEFTFLGNNTVAAEAFTSTDLVTWTPFDQPTTFGQWGGSFFHRPPAGVSSCFYRVRQGTSLSQVIGFSRTTIEEGKSALIANQFQKGRNSVEELFSYSDFPDLLTVSKQNSDRTGYDNSTFDQDIPGWSNPTLTLSPGEGAWLQNPNNPDHKACNVTFIGTVREGSLVNIVPPGYSIRSAMVPQALTISALGYPGYPGDSILRWTGSIFDSYYYDPDANRWTANEPFLNVGEAFWIYSDSLNSRDWTRDFSVPAP